MKQLPEPHLIIEIDLPKVAKQMIYLTGTSYVLLLVLQMIIQQTIDFSFSFKNILSDMLLLSLGYIVLIVLHEFFHLFGFRVFSKIPWRKMKVGVNLKLGIAYATTSEWMTNAEIRKSLLLPFWMTGVLPGIIGLMIDSHLLILLAALLIGGAAGDFSMYRALRKHPDDWLVKDHPTQPILYLYRPEQVHSLEVVEELNS